MGCIGYLNPICIAWTLVVAALIIIIREMINGIDSHDVDTEGIAVPRIVANCGISAECTTAKTSSAV